MASLKARLPYSARCGNRTQGSILDHLAQNSTQKQSVEVGKMIQWVGVTAAGPGDPNLIPTAPVVEEREMTPARCPLTYIGMPWWVSPPIN